MTEQADNPSATLALYADGPAQLEAALTGLTESDLDLARPVILGRFARLSTISQTAMIYGKPA